MKRSERKVTDAGWTATIEQKAFRRKLWVTLGMEQFARRTREHFTIKKEWATPILVYVEISFG